MAIPFLNNINLDNNELWNARLHNTGSANTNLGQIYFDTGDNLAKYYSNITDTWVSLKEYGFSNGTFVNLNVTGTTAKPIITAELSATGTANNTTFLRGDNTWATVVQENDFLTGLSFNTSDGVLTATIQNQSDVTVDLDGRYALASDIPATIVESVTGGTYITNSGTAADVILDHDATSRTDTTSTDAPAYGGTFEAVTSVTTNATGHITAIDVSTVTIPASDNTDNYVDSVSFNTGTGVLTLGRTGALADLTQSLDGRYLTGNQTITLTGEVTGSGTTSISTTVADGVLDVANFNVNAIVIESEGIENNDNDTTLPTSAAVKAYVDAATVGGLVYQGGYNASTNTPDLTTSPNSIEKGWTYTVTADGTFFGEQLRVGDVLIAEIDNPTALADWTTVQNNIDLASASQVGIGNVNAGTGISVSYSSGTATVTNTDTNSSNTYATTITDTATITHGLNTRDIIIQLYDATTYETVYADVERISTTQSTITFASTPTNSVRVLVQKIG